MNVNMNKLNQVYKPERLLYYTDTTPETIRDFCNGIIPDNVAKYSGAFGSYDYPGAFYIKSLGIEVIGIEFRPDDDRIAYPDDLKCVRLAPSLFYSAEVDDETHVTEEVLREIYHKIAQDSNTYRVHSNLSLTPNPDVFCVFLDFKKIRVMCECIVADDRAQYIEKDEVEKFDKDYLYRMAFFDPITSHYSWYHLLSFLEMPMDAGIHDYAFVHFDIKEFRVINEVYGHIAANEVLCNVVKAMNEADFVYASARCHNDNFAMIIKDMPEEEALSTLYDFFKKLSRLKEDPTYRIYYRCGYVPMQRALLLANRVADAGKLAQSLGTDHNQTEIITYTDKMHDDISWGHNIKAYVETAIENDEFVVYLQPKFDIATNRIKGAEALVRWLYKGKEFLSPARFIPFFERDGSIGKIDDIVLRKVLESFVQWKKEGRPLYPISVNLSRNRLYDKSLISHLIDMVDQYGVSHELIDFELTETATYGDKSHMFSVLGKLQDSGFKISMDDFGTGYSSLSLLTEMPLNTLKIDKSFVDKLTEDHNSPEDLIVIRHIISLAKELGFSCLAEGAEDRIQVDRLRDLGCEIIQGYYYSKPISIEEYTKKYL